jgi:hypothetical protein
MREPIRRPEDLFLNNELVELERRTGDAVTLLSDRTHGRHGSWIARFRGMESNMVRSMAVCLSPGVEEMNR